MTTPLVQTSVVAGATEPQQDPVGDTGDLAPTDAPSVPLSKPPRSPAVTNPASDQIAVQEASQTDTQKSGRRTRPAIFIGAVIGVTVLLIGTIVLTRSDDTDPLASRATEPDVTVNPTPSAQTSTQPPPTPLPSAPLSTTGPTTETTENDPGLFAYDDALIAFEMRRNHITIPFDSGDQTYGIMQLSGMDWSPFDDRGLGTWHLVRFFNHGEGSIEPVTRFETPNDADMANVSVEVIGAGSMRYPFIVFRWCCPMLRETRTDDMVTVVQVIDGSLVEVTTGAPLGPASPTYWSNDLSPDRLELDFGYQLTNVEVGEDGKAYSYNAEGE